MLAIQFDKENGKPLYLQLYEKIRDDIRGKEFLPNQKLPSKRELAIHLGVSVKTVENAYHQLMLEGYIYSKEKSGYYAGELNSYPETTFVKKTYVRTKVERDYVVDFCRDINSRECTATTVWQKLAKEVAFGEPQFVNKVRTFNGIYELRKAIADHLRRFNGLNVSPDQVVVCSGVDDIFARILQFLGMDLVYAIEDPGSNKTRGVFRRFGVKYECVPFGKAGEMVSYLTEKKVNVLSICPSNNFPYGTVTPIAERIELFRWADKSPDRYIIEDDYNSEYRHTGNPIYPMYASDWFDQVIYINEFVKTALPSTSVGYMVLPEKLMRRYEEEMGSCLCGVSDLEQRILAKYISEGHIERYINVVRRHNARQREVFTGKITEGINPSKAELEEESEGTHFILRIKTTMTDEDIRREFEKRGVKLYLMSDYCEGENKALAGTLVLNYSDVSDAQFDYFIEKFNEIFE